MSFTLREKMAFAQQMREAMTPAELALWTRINKRQIGFRFVRQGLLWGFIADFYCAKAKLAVEVDGSVHDRQQPADRKREAILEEYGIVTIRFTNQEVLDRPGMVIANLRRECEYRTRPLKASAVGAEESLGAPIASSKRGCGSPNGKSGDKASSKEIGHVPGGVNPVRNVSKQEYEEIVKRLSCLKFKKALSYEPPAAHRIWEMRRRLAEYSMEKGMPNVRPGNLGTK